MAAYSVLMVLRIILWAAFFLFCLMLALVNPMNFKFPNFLSWAPLVTLVLAVIVGLLERFVRESVNEPPRRWLGHSKWWGWTPRQLHATIRVGKVKPGMTEEIMRLVRTEALPVLKDADGFRGYLAVEGPDDTIIAVALFDSQSMAELSAKEFTPWIEGNLGPKLASPVKTIVGTVILSA
jgi:hypothetical protein